MTDHELREFWRACDAAGTAGTAGRYCLLTATRRTEATSASWSELSGDGVWTIPSNRYKTRREHVVPLSQAAAAVVSGLDKTSPYLFSLTECAPDPWSMWNSILDAGGPKGEGLSWHSLRKTARTLMSRAGVRADYAERALGHVQGTIERAYDKYNYTSEKRAALEALAAEVDRIVNDGGRANVVPLRAA